MALQLILATIIMFFAFRFLCGEKASNAVVENGWKVLRFLGKHLWRFMVWLAPHVWDYTVRFVRWVTPRLWNVCVRFAQWAVAVFQRVFP